VGDVVDALVLRQPGSTSAGKIDSDEFSSKVAKGVEMTENFTIEAAIGEGAVEINASYPESAMIDAGFDEPLGQRLIERYEELGQKQSNRDCILTLKAKVAGSPVIKAIYELWKVVRAHSGTLICANYPPDYVRALTDLGLPSLPGFELCSSTEEARKMLKLRREPEA
jgi:hypothetical protein